MSSRVLRRLRQDQDDLLKGGNAAEQDEYESSDEEEAPPKKAGFAFIIDSDQDEDNESSEENSTHDNDEGPVRKAAGTPAARADETADKEEDLDAVLEEFKLRDDEVEYGPDGIEDKNSTYYDIITSNIEARGLDIDFVQRTSLLGNSDEIAPLRSRRGRQQVFGPARDGWPRPPHYVGGGMGMVTYDVAKRSPAIPWPYSEMKAGDERCPEPQRWFLFTYSDSYDRDREDLEHVKMSGDPNALALYIAHHPFIVEALLQLSTVLQQTNSSHEALSLLKRALYTFECASLNSFLQVEDRLGFMDIEQTENELFFSALFRLIRVSHIAGLPRTSLSASRFLLSLDPLRDPMSILLAMDHFALVSSSPSNDQWLVSFVESEKVKIHYKDDTSEHGYKCELVDLPNWAYSYALALYRIDRNQPTGESTEKADRAMKHALSRFPSVLEQLLVHNEINTQGRSFQMDWPSVLHFARKRADLVENTLTAAAKADPVVRSCTSQAFDLITRIFVQQNFKMWNMDAVWQFAYRNLKDLQENPEEIVPLQPAIMRYARCDPSDYEDKIQTMPADANPLDPGLVAHAMTIDTNRPRFMQRGARARGGMQDEFDMALAGLNQQGTVIAGPPTEMIDPDWPVMEVFWRSFMPWAHVEGVPPPRR